MLLPCPWCGKTPEHITLAEGSTYRWAIVSPDCCGDIMGEIRRSPYPAKLGTDEDRQSAVDWWNTRFDSSD
jgi:hypothetical protein